MSITRCSPAWIARPAPISISVVCANTTARRSRDWMAHGRPLADKDAIAAHRLEILGYEWTRRGDATTMATSHLYQAQPHSGVVLHLGAPEASNGNAPGCQMMRQVCHEFVRRLLSAQSPFADRAPRDVVFAMHTPWKQRELTDGVCKALPLA